MKFETLIAIGTVIYVLVSVMKSVSSMKNKDEKPKSSPGWMDMIKDILAEIEKANNPQQPPPIPGKTGTGRPLPQTGPARKTPPPRPVATKTSPSPTKEKTREPIAPPVPSTTSVQASSKGGSPVLPSAAPTKSAPVSKAFKSASRKKIREAVIWNEILSPPLSLRDR
jgi:hypothetical protein